MQHNINNVEALWPRINKTYKFDSAERKSVPCPPSDPAAAYEMSFRMTADQAKALWGKMLEAYNASKEPSWPEQPVNPLKREEDSGCYIAKAKLKGNYNGDLTKGVPQYDASGARLADDFMLTTGSMVNVAVKFIPYSMREAGVSLRLQGVQVVRYKEMEEQNPFEKVDGFVANDANVNPFASQPTAPAPAPQADPFGLPPVQSGSRPASHDFNDEIPFAPVWQL